MGRCRSAAMARSWCARARASLKWVEKMGEYGMIRWRTRKDARLVQDGLRASEEERVVDERADQSPDDGTDDRAPQPVLIPEREHCAS